MVDLTSSHFPPACREEDRVRAVWNPRSQAPPLFTYWREDYL